MVAFLDHLNHSESSFNVGAMNKKGFRGLKKATTNKATYGGNQMANANTGYLCISSSCYINDVLAKRNGSSLRNKCILINGVTKIFRSIDLSIRNTRKRRK